MATTLPLPALPGEILSSFWGNEKAISDNSRQKGLGCVFEGHIQDVKQTQRLKHVKKKSQR